MPKFEKVALLLVVALVLGGTARGGEKPVTVKGYVIDSSCTFVKSLKKPISSKCAVECAKAGSPLVILTDDGTIYWPISRDVPASGQNERLLPFAGDRVAVTGTVYTHGGSRAIVMNKIEKAGAN